MNVDVGVYDSEIFDCNIVANGKVPTQSIITFNRALTTVCDFIKLIIKRYEDRTLGTPGVKLRAHLTGSTCGEAENEI